MEFTAEQVAEQEQTLQTEVIDGQMESQLSLERRIEETKAKLEETKALLDSLTQERTNIAKHVEQQKIDDLVKDFPEYQNKTVIQRELRQILDEINDKELKIGKLISDKNKLESTRNKICTIYRCCIQITEFDNLRKVCKHKFSILSGQDQCCLVKSYGYGEVIIDENNNINHISNNEELKPMFHGCYDDIICEVCNLSFSVNSTEYKTNGKRLALNFTPKIKY